MAFVASPTQGGVGAVTPSGSRISYPMGRITVDPTGITGFSATATFIISVGMNEPITKALPDIFSRLGIYPQNFTLATTNKSKYKVTVAYQRDGTYNDDVADLGKTWAENGVHSGDTIKLNDAP